MEFETSFVPRKRPRYNFTETVKIDPATVLPDEIMMRIFTLLPSISLPSCYFVNKNWRKLSTHPYVLATMSYWDNIFGEHSYQLEKSDKEHEHRQLEMIKSARNLSISDWTGETIRDNLALISSQLQYLKLFNVENITDTDLICLPENLPEILINRCTRLTDLCIQNLPKGLKELALISCPGISGVPSCKYPSKLESLRIFSCQNVDSSSLEGFPPNLTSLNLPNNFKIAVGSLKNLPHSMRALKLNHQINVTDQCFKELRGDLNQLKLIGCQNVTGEFIKTLSKLTHLLLRDCDINDTYLHYLSKKLKSLELFQINITDAALERLPPRITHLNFWRCSRLTDRCISHLSHLTELKSLEFTRSENLTGEGFQFLPENISLLNLSFNEKMTDEYLAHLHKNSSLTTLNLSASKISGTCFRDLPSSIQSLYLSSCHDLTEEGLTTLESLDQLESLSLQFAGELTVPSLTHLPRTLKSLDLSESDCTDQHLQILSEFKQLKTLSLRHCSITDAGIKYLPDSIIELDLFGCHGLTDKCLFHLPKSLLKVNLMDCIGISKEAINQFKEIRKYVIVDTWD